jgi:hypothetical protein
MARSWSCWWSSGRLRSLQRPPRWPLRPVAASWSPRRPLRLVAFAWSPLAWSPRPVASRWSPRSPRSVRSRSSARSRRRPTALVACRHACRCCSDTSLPCGSRPNGCSASSTFQRWRYSMVCSTARSQARPPLTVVGRSPRGRATTPAAAARPRGRRRACARPARAAAPGAARAGRGWPPGRPHVAAGPGGRGVRGRRHGRRPARRPGRPARPDRTAVVSWSGRLAAAIALGRGRGRRPDLGPVGGGRSPRPAAARTAGVGWSHAPAAATGRAARGRRRGRPRACRLGDGRARPG